MMKLLCEENNLEYAGSGYLQCGRHVACPKKKNNKVLGFDCIMYIDNLPDGYKTDIPEQESINDNLVKIEVASTMSTGTDHVANKTGYPIRIIPVSEQAGHGSR